MPRRPASDSSSSNSSDSDSSEDSIKIVSITVENLTPNVTEDHLKEIFINFGEIRSLGIRPNFNPKVKSYAVINYSSK